MSAAETGHVVMSTLHTINAGQTVERLIGMFDQEEEKQIRIRLAETVRWIVSQRLLPKIGGGRVAALEIMGNSLRVKEAIEHGESEGKTFYDIIEASTTYGWKTFDMSVLELYEQGLVTEETALLYCTNKGVVSRGIDRIKKSKGISTTDLNLKLDLQYGKRR
jgi:twitching motility protein PilT